MVRWTVQDGDQDMVIEARGDRIIVDIPSGLPFTTDADGIRDMRRKLGLAIGEVSPGSDSSHVDV